MSSPCSMPVCAEVEVQCIGRLPDRGDKFLNRNLVSGGSAVLRECCGDLLVAHAGESVSLTLYVGIIPQVRPYWVSGSHSGPGVWGGAPTLKTFVPLCAPFVAKHN